MNIDITVLKRREYKKKKKLGQLKMKPLKKECYPDGDHL